MNAVERPSFLDMATTELDQADAAIIPVPWEHTVSYGTGTAHGPSAVLTAGPHLETFDEELGVDLSDLLGLATLSALGPDKGERSEAYLPRLRDSVAALGLAPPFPIFLGGEHSITAALLAGLRDRHEDLTVVHLDAHADLRDSYGGSPHNHACSMRRVLDLGISRLISVGVRSCEREEFEFARNDSRIQTYYAHRLQEAAVFEGLLADLRLIDGPVYLTIDIDGLDCTLCPGTGTPQPGGLSWYQALTILRATIRESAADVLGAEIVEVVPMVGSQLNEMVAAKLAFKILGYRFAPEQIETTNVSSSPTKS
jgi:N1-aminopropylagmatine ureohydrolase